MINPRGIIPSEIIEITKPRKPIPSNHFDAVIKEEPVFKVIKNHNKFDSAAVGILFYISRRSGSWGALRVNYKKEGVMGERTLTDEDIKAMFSESGKWLAKVDERLDRIAEQVEKTAQQMAANDRKFANMRKEVSGIGDSNGFFAEDAIYDSLYESKRFGGVEFGCVSRGMKGDLDLPNGEHIKGEYDVVLINSTSVAIVEAKYRVRKKDLDRLLTVQLPRFKLIFPMYAAYTVYLGIGGMSFESGVEEEALQNGVGTLKLNGEAVEINDANVKAWQ